MKKIDLDITIPLGNDLQTQKIPAGLEQYIIKGGQVYSVEGSFGSLLVQLVNLPNYELRYTILDCQESVSLRKEKKEMPKVEIALQNTMHWHYEGIGDTILEENTCAISYLPETEATGIFNAGSQYRTLEISISVEAFASLSYTIPLIDSFLENARNEEPTSIKPATTKLTPHLLKVINDILRFSYTDKLLSLYGDNSIQGLIMLILREASLMQENAISQPDRTDKMERAKILLRNSFKKYPGTEFIAKELGMNTTTLRENFATAFKTTLWDYWYQQRMEITGRMLKEGKDIKEIVAETGFTSNNTFTRAFRNYFKQPPDEWRRNLPGIDKEQRL